MRTRKVLNEYVLWILSQAAIAMANRADVLFYSLELPGNTQRLKGPVEQYKVLVP